MEPPPPKNGSPFKAWLASLGRDGSAALAAGEVYGSLPADERNAWLDAVASDLASPSARDVAEGESVAASVAAAYAPLLAHEQDPGRRARILSEITKAGLGEDVGRMRALMGAGRFSFERLPCQIVVLLRGLAFDLCEALICAITMGEDGEQIRAATYLGLASAVEAERVAQEMGAPCTLSPADPREATDVIAHGVWSDARAGREPRPDLAAAAHFFAVEPPSFAGGT